MYKVATTICLFICKLILGMYVCIIYYHLVIATLRRCAYTNNQPDKEWLHYHNSHSGIANPRPARANQYKCSLGQ